MLAQNIGHVEWQTCFHTSLFPNFAKYESTVIVYKRALYITY